MEPAHREFLAQQADDLAAGLDAFAAVAKDAGSLLTRLDKHLAKLNKVNAPIFDQAARLTWAEQNIAAAKVATDQLVVHLGTAKKVEAALRQGPGRDLSSYLALLHQLEAAMAALEAQHTLQAAQDAYEHASKVHRKALQDCEADFVAVLSQQTSACLPSASALMNAAEQGALQAAVSSPSLPEFTPKALARLRSLADLLKMDPQSTAFTAYAQVRARALAAVLRGAGGQVAPGTSAAVQGQEQAEKAAASWSRQLRMLTVASASEQALAEAVWGAGDDVMQVVGEVIQQSLDMLVQQGKDMAKGRAQPFRVFVLLEMLRHMEEVLPLLDDLLGRHSEYEEGLLEPLRDVQEALADTAKELFAVFESGIARDSSKAQVVDGTVHPLTASTLGYLRRLFTFGDTTQVLFVERGRGGGAMAELSQQVAAKRMAEAVYRCMAGLLTALEAKARVYKSRPLASVFLMNNVHYMVATVEQSESLAVLGKTWVETHKDIIEQYGQEYHELVWMPLVRQLQAVQDGEDPEPTDMIKWKEWVKKHFKAVNKVLEKSCTEQSAWSMPDPRLRRAVCRVILQDLMPPYQHFWETYSHADFTPTRSKYVRCSPDDLERMVTNDLFNGRPMSVMWARTQKPGGNTPEKLVPMPTLSEPSAVSLPPMPRPPGGRTQGTSGVARSVR